MFCEKCGKSIADGSLFCDGCGAKVTPPDAAAEKTPVAAAAVMTAKKPVDKKALIGIGVIAAVVVIVVLAVALIAGGGSADAPLLYVVDEDLVCSNGKVGDGKTVIEGWINDDMRYDAGDAGTAALVMSYYSFLTSDGETFVYLSDYDTDDETFSLYAVSTKALKRGDAEAKAEKIASGVDSAALADGTDLLLYTRESKLYCYDFRNDPALVTKDFVGAISPLYTYGVAVSDDGKTVAALRSGDDWYDLYLYTVKTGESEKIDTDVYSVLDYDAENGFAAMVYVKMDENYDETLYRAGTKAEKEKLLSKVYSIESAATDGYAFYVEAEEDSYDESLYVLDLASGEKQELTDEYGYSLLLDSDSGLGVYCAYDDGDEAYYVVCGGETTALDEEIADAAIGPDGKSLYLIEGEYGDDDATLVRYAIGKDGLGSREKIASDVSADLLTTAGKWAIYSTDGDDDDAALLVAFDGKNTVELGEDAAMSTITEYGDGLLFFADYDSYDGEGALYFFDGKTATKIADDVCRLGCVELGDALYFLTDYDEDDGGALYVWDGKKKTKLAADVLAIIPLD